MIVRRQAPGDHEVVPAPFATVSSPEFVDRLRASDAWQPALSFVGLGADGEVVGQAASTIAMQVPGSDRPQRCRAFLPRESASSKSSAELLSGSSPRFAQRFS